MEFDMFWAVILAVVFAIVGVSIVAGKVIGGRGRPAGDPEDSPILPDPF
jgi:hypothetical protein